MVSRLMLGLNWVGRRDRGGIVDGRGRQMVQRQVAGSDKVFNASAIPDIGFSTCTAIGNAVTGEGSRLGVIVVGCAMD